MLLLGGSSHGGARLADLWYLPVSPAWLAPDAVGEPWGGATAAAAAAAAPPLAWRQLTPLDGGVGWVEPRSSHAALLHEGSLYTIGGEAGGGGTLWRLDLRTDIRTLGWSVTYSPPSANHPLPGAGASLVLLKPAPSTPRVPQLLLLGGQRAAADGAGLALWRFELGARCGDANGTRACDADGGTQCDESSGDCVCSPGAACDPIRANAHRIVDRLRRLATPPALESVSAAWAIVGASFVGALLGNLAQAGVGRLRLLIGLSRRGVHWRHPSHLPYKRQA